MFFIRAKKGCEMNYLKHGYAVAMILSCATLFIGCDWLRGSKNESTKNRLLLVNVLDQSYFEDCHIDARGKKNVESLHVPFDQIVIKAKSWDKSTCHIVTYCSNFLCSASGAAAKDLIDMGFEHVWAYEGGIAEWKQAGNPVEGPCIEEYLTKVIAKSDVDHDFPVITIQELQKKIEEFAAK
jgi:rhodanese-related sulfurtransferase